MIQSIAVEVLRNVDHTYRPHLESTSMSCSRWVHAKYGVTGLVVYGPKELLPEERKWKF